MGNCVSVNLLLGWGLWVTVSQSSYCWGGGMGKCVSVKLLLGWELWVTVSQASCCWGGCHG